MNNDPSNAKSKQEIVQPARMEENTPVFEFEALSDSGNLIYVELGGVLYELRRTKNKKLILNR